MGHLVQKTSTNTAFPYDLLMVTIQYRSNSEGGLWCAFNPLITTTSKLGKMSIRKEGGKDSVTDFERSR